MFAVRKIRLVLAVGVVVLFNGCPLLNSFTIRIDNNAQGIAVTVIRLVDLGTGGNVTKNLLPIEVDPGDTRRLLVMMDDVGDADAVKIRVQSVNPQQPLSFSITRLVPGGFEAGKTVVVTVEGSPTQSVSIELDVESDQP